MITWPCAAAISSASSWRCRSKGEEIEREHHRFRRGNGRTHLPGPHHYPHDSGEMPGRELPLCGNEARPRVGYHPERRAALYDGRYPGVRTPSDAGKSRTGGQGYGGRCQGHAHREAVPSRCGGRNGRLRLRTHPARVKSHARTDAHPGAERRAGHHEQNPVEVRHEDCRRYTGGYEAFPCG